jgi:hypothetical protein
MTCPNDTLENLSDAYKVEGARQEFDQTALRYYFRKTASGGQTLVKSYSWSNSPEMDRLFDYCHLQKSSVRLDEDEQGKTPVPVSHSAA